MAEIPTFRDYTLLLVLHDFFVGQQLISPIHGSITEHELNDIIGIAHRSILLTESQREQLFSQEEHGYLLARETWRFCFVVDLSMEHPDHQFPGIPPTEASRREQIYAHRAGQSIAIRPSLAANQSQTAAAAPARQSLRNIGASTTAPAPTPTPTPAQVQVQARALAEAQAKVQAQALALAQALAQTQADAEQ
ncbi:hypothetical protein SBOR_7029 [Sclerotinia borealis F-4128]|uniref:Uncharacterized protein n=1 Tax=Sclerotinia borealis (strain F-4128) TaxID=1432307 RepID=W9C773_SCLBF|nr:hypothetical protein SBOR_7029 [Sclerotinia borealis F-4128]